MKAPSSTPAREKSQPKSAKTLHPSPNRRNNQAPLRLNLRHRPVHPRRRITPHCVILCRRLVGAGPVGMVAGLTAKLYTPARNLGSHVAVQASGQDAIQKLLELTKATGLTLCVDVCVLSGAGGCGRAACMGPRSTCTSRPRGIPISVSFFYIGSHWPLGTDLLGIRMPLVNTTTTPQLLRLVEPGMLDIGSLVTHRMFA